MKENKNFEEFDFYGFAKKIYNGEPTAEDVRVLRDMVDDEVVRFLNDLISVAETSARNNGYLAGVYDSGK